MSKKQRLPKPKSLAQLFEAPENWRGFFGWLCGYSGDALFLSDALERFTRQTSGQRAQTGKISLAGMLDPTMPWISPVDVPGFAHLRIKDIANRPFRLLHAKVALLGFRADHDSEQWRIRLIVSTGNWTRGTMEETLDLAWHTEIARQNLRDDSAGVRATRTDINAAWDILRWLRELCDTRILTAVPRDRPDAVTATSDAHEWFDGVASKVRSANGTTSRFFDNRQKSLLVQIPAKLRAMAIPVKRNYLGMGSGFFEATSGKTGIPSVLKRIVKTLQEKELLTRNPEVDVFVNPQGCQAVAAAIPDFEEEGWTVRKAYMQEAIFGEGSVRALHAKFIFSGNERAQSDTCTSPWLYLGSGNLTGPGFVNQMKKDFGNLEAGVVLDTGDLYWGTSKTSPPERTIPNLLPMRWDDNDILTTQSDAAEGPPFEERENDSATPPISFMFWRGEDKTGVLTPPDGAQNIAVIDPSGAECESNPHGGFIWPGQRPRQVKVRWHTENAVTSCALVPVLDEFGRISATPLQSIELDEAWRQLESFPMAPDDDDADGGEGGADADSTFEGNDVSRQRGASVYPIRSMMELIEKIAAQQTGICRADWTAWCNRLEQTLIQTKHSTAVKEFVDLVQLNPLGPLHHAPFRPDFAETAESPEGSRYEESLSRIEKSWGVEGLAGIGEMNHAE